jgi:hypothetical protein
MKKRKHFGSKFDDFLEELDLLEECRASAIKFKIAHELQKVMNQRHQQGSDCQTAQDQSHWQ